MKKYSRVNLRNWSGAAWRKHSLKCTCPVSRCGEFENAAILVAIAVNKNGYREVLGAAEGTKEDKASWVSFFQRLRGRGLEDVKLVVGDKCLGMLEAVGEVFGQIPAVYGPFLPQCVLCNASIAG